MKVDAYRSKSKPAYGLVVPAGVDVGTFKGEVGAAVAALQPLEKTKSGKLDDMYRGDLLGVLESQIAQSGAGLVKIVAQFDEVTP
jgi:hypothetical protein